VTDSSEQLQTDPQSIFVELVEAAPDAPLEALAARGLPEELFRRVERMVVAYLRTRRLERELAATDGEIARALAEAEDAPIESVDRSIPARLAGYRIERVLGEGPHAVVLLAHQETPIERAVAIKLLFADASDPRVAVRAEHERQILASLEHPNIARIYDFGIDGVGRPFLVMEYVRGGTVAEWCRGRGLTEREIVGGVFLGIASAVRFAHAHGVLHRDIKCANALVQDIDGVPHAKVIDFGIARALGGDLAERAGLAELPQAIGTLASLSPEALDPSAQQLDARSDVFGLGIVLLELLAGRPARVFEGGDLAAALRMLVEKPTPRLHELAPGASRDIDAIVAKATAQRPDDRYQSVAEFVTDLEAFVADRAVTARRRSVLERTTRLVRRRWRLLTAVLAATLPAVIWIGAESSRFTARLEVVSVEARSTIDAARGLRNAAGRGAERDDLVSRALDATRAAELLAPGSTEVAALRADAVEEAILPRLLRGEAKSRETVALVEELVALRERIAVEFEDSPGPLERLSVALAYRIDTVWDTPAYESIEARQLELDERLHALYPDSSVYADNICWTYQRVLDPIYSRGERERAMEYLRRSAAISEASLAKYGRTPVTLHTALAAAWYEAIERGIAGDRAGFLAASSRARKRGTELLAASPDHARGAVMLIRAAADEAFVHLDQGDAHDAVRIIEGARATAAGSAASERGTGFLRTPLADCLVLEARAALLLGELDRAERALQGLRDEIDLETDSRTHGRWDARERYTAAHDLLRTRIDSRRGESAAAQEQLALLLASIRRSGPSSSAGRFSIEAIAHQLGDMRRLPECAAVLQPLVAEIALLRRLSEPGAGEDPAMLGRWSVAEARLLAAAGDPAPARRILGEVADAPRTPPGTVLLVRVAGWAIDALESIPR
jgi:predicted Ser/Thr protein kinase